MVRRHRIVKIVLELVLLVVVIDGSGDSSSSSGIISW